MNTKTYLTYAKDAKGKTVYAFMRRELCSRQVESLALVPITSCEARKLYGREIRSDCDEFSFTDICVKK
jgi:hypothetical protein